MTTIQISIQDFIAQTSPFNQLSNDEREKLARSLTPFRYRMGQPILLKDKPLHQVSILYEGQVRYLGYDPGQKTNLPLELLQPGALIGWVNFVRGVACETAIASTEVVCLTFTYQEFAQLLNRVNTLKAIYQEQCSLVEVFDILAHQMEQKAKANLNLKQFALEITSQGKPYHLAPGKYNLEDDLISPLKRQDQIWFVSGGEILDFPLRSELKLTQNSNNLEIKGTNPARLIGFPSQLWDQIFETLALSPVEEEFKDPWVQEGETVTSTVEVLTEEGWREKIPEGSLNPINPPLIEEKYSKSSLKKYPYIRGKSPVDASVACFQMLSQHFKMPFRREIIQKVVKEQITRQGSLPLSVAGAIVELMGLNAQLARIPATALTKLEAPLLVMWQDSLGILYEISDQSLVIGVPEIGILRRKPQDFIDTWGEQGEVLLLQKTKNTPEQKFGLNWFFPSVIKYKWVLLEVLIASFFVQLFALANPLVIQEIIDKVIVQNSPDTLQFFGILLVILAIFEAILTSLRTYLFVDTTNRIDMSLGSEIIDHLVRLPLGYFEKRPVGEISTRINELENIRQFLTGTALTVVLDAVFTIVYIVVMFIYNVPLTLVALSVIPIFILLTIITSPIIRRQIREKAERNAETQSYLVEVMSGIQTVKAQNIELRSRWRWQENYARYVSAGFKTVLTSTAASSMSNFLNKLSALLVLWVGTGLVLEGPEKLTLGQLIAFRIISGYVTSPLLRLSQLWQNFQETALSLERLSDIVDTPQEAQQDRENIPMPEITGAVTYENINFRFKHNAPLQLCQVDLEIKPGTFVAVVGQSGAGKSTLTKLLSRLYEPESGRILIDGYDINKVELYSLRRQVGVVPQDPLLFQGSVQENIALTNPDASSEQIIEAAKIAAAHDFIMTLPNGYNTRVGERGAALSGGQRQRIAIARSVLQRPRLLILDEATSALDYKTEHEVCVNLKKTFHDTTVFFITHRLGTIRDADTIVLMEAGRIAEQGTHEELMALRGYYYSLFQQQASSSGK